MKKFRTREVGRWIVYKVVKEGFPKAKTLDQRLGGEGGSEYSQGRGTVSARALGESRFGGE